VVAVGIEREQGEIGGLARSAAEDPFLSAMLHSHGTAAVFRRQDDHERADHLVSLFGVLVRLEELPFLVEEQLVEHRLELSLIGKTEVGLNGPQVPRECGFPGSRGDLDAARGDLPGVAHRQVV
jgi:hypothetical protein